jgi:hypothetical protein
VACVAHVGQAMLLPLSFGAQGSGSLQFAARRCPRSLRYAANCVRGTPREPALMPANYLPSSIR